MQISSKTQRNIVLTGISLFILGFGVRLVPGIRIIDDAYITFRYVDNILNGYGFAYNPGVPVLGTTTPLYTFTLVSISWLLGFTGAHLPGIAVILNAVLGGLSCHFLWKIGMSLHSIKVGAAAAILWAFAPFSVTFSIGGLETSLYCLLLIACVYTYLMNRTVQSAFLGSLAILTRPDALILVGLVSLHFFSDRINKRSWNFIKEALAIFIPLAIWAVIATILFGSPIPNSVQAKLVAYLLPETAALVRLIQHFATPFMLHHVTGTPAAIAIGIFLYPFLFFIGARKALRTAPQLLPFALYPWLYFAVFAAANPLIFRWYLTPPLPAYFLFILLGIEALLTSILTKINVSKQVKRTILWSFMLALPLITTLSAWELTPDHGPRKPAPQMAWNKLELIYEDIAFNLLPDINPGTVIAAGDVGALGYFSKATILDTVGLNTPESSAYYPLPADAYVINYAIPSNLILDYKPDFVIFLEIYGRNTLLKDKQFLEAYHQYKAIPTNIYGSKAMYVYQLEP